MVKNAGLFFLMLLCFSSSVCLVSNVFAESYIEGGNEIIKKIYDDITLLKKGNSELKSFDAASLNKSRRDELYISYGEPPRKTDGKETTYIYISYSKLPMSFKTWEYGPSVFYSLKYDLFVGYCIDAKDKLREELLKLIEKNVR
ncbi:MAG: hypothetical protein WC546_01720 [Candidatus Omnitrophota bacterium]|jgi:hypothetical protein